MPLLDHRLDQIASEQVQRCRIAGDEGDIRHVAGSLARPFGSSRHARDEFPHTETTIFGRNHDPGCPSESLMDCVAQGLRGRFSALPLPTALLLSALVFPASGCKEEAGETINRESHSKAVVQVVCEAYTSCDCDDEVTVLDNDLECPVALQPVVEAAMANAADLDLRYHGECLSKYRSYLDIVACNTPFEVDGMWEAGDAKLRSLSESLDQCKLVAGDVDRGGTCASVTVAGSLLGDTCEHGLVCAEGLCRPWPKSAGDWCGGVFDCPGDLACLDPDADGVLTCEARATAGQLCNPHDAAGCLDDMFCDTDERTCERLPKAGKPCLTNAVGGATCDKGSVCGGEMCEALRGIGDDCTTGVCNPSLAYCGISSGECIALPSKGDDCSDSQGLCAPGLSCVGESGDVECREAAPMVCSLPELVGVCIYADDGICDEPEGTDLCAEGTDPVDCLGNGSRPRRLSRIGLRRRRRRRLRRLRRLRQRHRHRWRGMPFVRRRDLRRTRRHGVLRRGHGLHRLRRGRDRRRRVPAYRRRRVRRARRHWLLPRRNRRGGLLEHRRRRMPVGGRRGLRRARRHG